MNSNLSSDKPIQQEKDDRFQRYPFSKRIADTIIERQDKNCIVLGLYGAWGEGKSSVLNFIDFELARNENIIIVKFNPWRFKDEETLLNDYFQLLATKLGTSLKDGEVAKKLLKKYGKLSAPVIKFIPVVGGAIGEALENIGESLSDETVEDLKEKIDQILIDNQKKIVVFIDDIDRLDKSEIHSIFRLVKLTADFCNTTYILSFDDQMVSSAIGERFGEGNKEAGKSFLEKIIQVPLNLPLAQADALQKYCFDIINEVLKTNNIELNDDEGKRFSSQFQNNVLTRLSTPRLAVRFGNALSFAIPLLKGEVNIDDLLLIEAIKIFYPDHYEFVKHNPEYFIGTYNDVLGEGREKNKIEEINKQLDRLGLKLTTKQKNRIESLLLDIFPRLRERNTVGNFSEYNENKLSKNKRIGSLKYFNRFFSYAVIKGDLSDIAFQNFINNVPQQSIDQVMDSIKELVAQSTPDNFLLKIRNFEKDLSWEVTSKIAKAIVSISDIFPKYEGGFFIRSQHPNGQSQILIRQFIKQNDNNQEQFNLVMELIKEAKDFSYAYSLLDWFRDTNSNEPTIFSEQQLLDFDYYLIHRAIRESEGTSIFKKFPDTISHLINSWSKINKPELMKYTLEQFEKDSEEVIQLLNIYTPTIISSAESAPYKADFTKEYYQHIITIFDKDFLCKWILKVFSLEIINEEPVKWFGRDKGQQTSLNIVRQFVYWMKEEEENSK